MKPRQKFPEKMPPASRKEPEETLGHADADEARRRSAPPSVVVFEAIRHEGESEMERSTANLWWSGLAAGLSMGFSFIAEALLQSYLPDAPWRPLVTKFGYCVGFLIVVLGRQQLFTENTLTPVLHLLREKSRSVLVNMLRLWGIVLLANFVGGFCFALLVSIPDLFDQTQRTAMLAVASNAYQADFTWHFFHAVFAGWLIALMVWLLPLAETARIFVIIIITYLVGLGGFSHIIAGAVEVFYLMLHGEVPLLAPLGLFFLPVLLGNMIGGIAFVAAINYAQALEAQQRKGA